MANHLNQELDKWGVNQIRFTAFPSPTSNVFDNPEESWSYLAGDKPENITQSPQVGKTVVTGMVELGTLVLDVQPNRIDWLVVVPDTQPDLLAIGPFSNVASVFKGYIDKWFSSGTCPKLHRFAFGAHILQNVKSKEEGYETLDKYLPFITLDPVNSSDFNYRINRPRPSKNIEDLYINRLSTWAVLTRSLMTIGLPNPQMHNQIKDINCSLQLDINTFDDYTGEFSQENLPIIFTELTDLGKEIATKGDIK